MTTVKDIRRDEIFEGNEVIFVEYCVTIAVYTNKGLWTMSYRTLYGCLEVKII